MENRFDTTGTRQQKNHINNNEMISNDNIPFSVASTKEISNQSNDIGSLSINGISNVTLNA